MQDLRKAKYARRIELKNKYNAKLRHLEENRRREVEEKRDRIPNELKEYEDCNVFDREKFEKIEKDKFDVVTLGGLELDEEEKEVLRLNPKFAALKKLDKEECERDVEVGLMKIRLEVKRREKYKLENDVEYTDADGKKRKIDCEEFDEEKEDLDDALERQVYDPVTKTFDYSRKRTTDLPENGQVYLPKAVNAKVESEMSIIRNIILEEFEKYKEEIDKQNENIEKKKEKDERKKRFESKINQEWKNLTNREKKGLRKLRKRIQKDEIVILKSDKSGRLIAMRKEEYLRMGLRQNGQDKKLTRKEILKIEESINDHTRMLSKAMNIGESHDHLPRVLASKIVNSENTAPKYYLYKDHKKVEAWRPVVSGCSSTYLVK